MFTNHRDAGVSRRPGPTDASVRHRTGPRGRSMGRP